MKILLEDIKRYSVAKAPGDNHSEVARHYCFDKDFVGFSGHFPGYPILPAVLQLLLAQIFIEEQKGYKISITAIEKAKFMSEIRSDDLISIRYTDADTGERKRCKVQIMCGERVITTFNLYFRPMKEDDSD